MRINGEDEVEAIASFGELNAMSTALSCIFEPHSLYRLRLLIAIVENNVIKKITYDLAIILGILTEGRKSRK